MDSNRITSIEKITALVKTFTNLNSYEALIDTIKINYIIIETPDLL